MSKGDKASKDKTYFPIIALLQGCVKVEAILTPKQDLDHLTRVPVPVKTYLLDMFYRSLFLMPKVACAFHLLFCSYTISRK